MNPEFFALSILILLFSVILHEVMHGVTALYFGDTTAQRSGRLTLNPLPHIDLLGTIILPFFLIITGSPYIFGWAKPVPVNPLNFNNIRRGELLVSLAGVGANFGLALVAALLYHLSNTFYELPLFLGSMFFMVNINLILTVFNLLPIPPLDGSKVVMALLPSTAIKQYAKWERYGPFILLLLLFFPFGGRSILGIVLGFFVRLLQRLLGF